MYYNVHLIDVYYQQHYFVRAERVLCNCIVKYIEYRVINYRIILTRYVKCMCV